MKDIYRYLNDKGYTVFQVSHKELFFSSKDYTYIVERELDSISYSVTKEYRLTGECCSPKVTRPSQQALIKFIEGYAK